MSHTLPALQGRLLATYEPGYGVPGRHLRQSSDSLPFAVLMTNTIPPGNLLHLHREIEGSQISQSKSSLLPSMIGY
jgi:hypothetical protein